jgi:hypothetical protein
MLNETMQKMCTSVPPLSVVCSFLNARETERYRYRTELIWAIFLQGSPSRRHPPASITLSYLHSHCTIRHTFVQEKMKKSKKSTTNR